MRIDGHDAPDSTTYRALKRAGSVLEVTYQADRRQHAKARRGALVVPPDGPNEVWQMDFSEFETRMGGSWQIGGCTDYWSKYELGWRISPTQNEHDAVAAVQLALIESERLLGCTLLEHLTDPETGEIRPVVVVTDNGVCCDCYCEHRYKRGHRKQREQDDQQSALGGGALVAYVAGSMCA